MDKYALALDCDGLIFDSVPLIDKAVADINYVAGNVVVYKTEYIQVHFFNWALDFYYILSSHLIRFGIHNHCDGAICSQFIQVQIPVYCHGFASLNMI